MYRSILSFFLLFALLGSFSHSQEVSSLPKKSSLFEYQGYQEASYEDHQLSSQFVQMSDGVRLAVDMYTPTQGPPQTQFPVILVYTPYNRSFLIPNMNPALKLISKVSGRGWGPIYGIPDIFEGTKLLLEHGYIIVAADMRGTGASFGSQMPLMPKLGQDGKELVDWIADQPWCNGNVGMLGPSYLGWGQFATAGNRPEALKCIMPEVIAFETYTETNKPGGISADRWIRGFSTRLKEINRNYYSLKRSTIPAVPVVDEDQDGKRQDDWPKIDSASLYGPHAPVYKDKQSREGNLYFEATKEHLDNVLLNIFLEEEHRYIDSRGPKPYEEVEFRDASTGSFAKEIMASEIPIYHVGGWFDGFLKGTTKLYSTMASSNPSKLMIAPRFHFPSIPKPYQSFLDYQGNYMEQLATEQLRFFDRYLKGIDNQIDKEAPVHLYVMHEGWQSASSWPPKKSRMTSFFLQENHHLSTEQRTSTTESDSYEIDFSVSSNYGKDDLNRWIMFERGPNKVMERTKIDEHCLIYESSPLQEEASIIGHPIVKLWLSSTQAYGDVYVYLSDVDEQGKAWYITEGQLRAGWHQLREDDTQVLGGIDVQPELPWHGYEQDQWADSALADGQVIEMVFDLIPTAWNIQKGHRIRIAIAGADFGNFELNPYLCPDGELDNCPETEWQIHRSSAYPSSIELPLISTD